VLLAPSNLWEEQGVKPNEVYVDLDGHEIALAGLDAEERKLVERLRRRARSHPDWTDFDNYWTREVGAFYDGRAVPRRLSRPSVPFRIAQDLSGRLGIAAGMMRPDDYQSDLEELIRDKFGSQRAFCKATGLAEDMLSHVLAGRKDLSLASLTQALERIGYRLRIVAAGEPAVPTGKGRRTSGREAAAAGGA
jgi:hypothetical protein